jgi:hypothetical protein
MQAPGQIAESLGMTKIIRINGLHEHDNAVTAFLPRDARFGALVEFSTRANPRSAHG